MEQDRTVSPRCWPREEGDPIASPPEGRVTMHSKENHSGRRTKQGVLKVTDIQMTLKSKKLGENHQENKR